MKYQITVGLVIAAAIFGAVWFSSPVQGYLKVQKAKKQLIELAETGAVWKAVLTSGQDPWGNDFKFGHSIERLEVTYSSAGPDGEHGTKDDIKVFGIEK